MGSVKMTTVGVIDEFLSVTVPSLPAITDLHLALEHLLKVSREQAQVWWQKFLVESNPIIRPEFEHCRDEILAIVEKGLGTGKLARRDRESSSKAGSTDTPTHQW
jgi:hypothetical protein